MAEKIVIKIAEDENGKSSCFMQGGTVDLLAYLLHCLKDIHTGLPDEARATFRKMVLCAVSDADSPVWDTAPSGEGVCMRIPINREEDEE